MAPSTLIRFQMKTELFCSVFGDRFRRCRVDDSRIRSKTAPSSFENGLVWTEPKAAFTRQTKSWQTRVGKLELVCVNGAKTVGKHCDSL